MPALAVVLLGFTWGRDLPGAVVALVTLVLAGAVLAAVRHAEVVAHGSVNPSAPLCSPDPDRRHRDYFLPITHQGDVITVDDHADTPSAHAALISLGLLGLALIGVVGLAKGVSPTIESGVEAADLPQALVGVVIALLVLLPETIAALRRARRDRAQTSLNLALGSAMAGIGLTVPAVALASIWLSGPLVLGLGATYLVLLALTVAVSSPTVVPGRATPLQGGVHLVLFAAYLALAINP